tara:strand:- start:157 stop:420 length:264 start_codon:yes stop_codon:yes gene_type:complete
MASIKAYLPKVVAWMKENGKDDEIKPFRAQATEFVKYVVGAFNKFTFYTGENGDKTAALGFSEQRDSDAFGVTTFYFMNVALNKEKI